MIRRRRPKRRRVVLHHPPETPTEKRAREDAVRDIARQRELDRLTHSSKDPHGQQ